MRVACVRVHYFSAAVERRDNRRLHGKPLVIGGQHWSVKPVYAPSAETARMGIYRGLPLREAHAIAPRAKFLPSAPRKYQQTLVNVDELLNQFMGVSEPVWTYPAVVDYLPCDDGRVSLLEQYARMIGQTVRQESGLPSSIGIGENKFTAYMAAKMTAPNHLRVVATCSHDFLAPIQMRYLSLHSVLHERLNLFGIVTLGQLAALPASAVREQFGTQGAALHQLASGVDHRAVTNPPRELTLAESYPFDDPVADWQILERAMGRLSADLHTQLRQHNRAAQAVRLTLELDDGTHLTPNAHLRQPTQSADILQRQLTQLLTRTHIHARVVQIAVTFARLVPVEVQQLSLFDFTQVAKRETLEEVVAELTERFESKVFVYGAPFQMESRLPERRWKWRKLAGSKNTAFHDVRSDRIVPYCDTDDTFSAFRWRGRRHEIAHFTKTWHVEQGWWEQNAERTYYKLRTDTGYLLTVYHDHAADEWTVQHVYD